MLSHFPSKNQGNTRINNTHKLRSVDTCRKVTEVDTIVQITVSRSVLDIHESWWNISNEYNLFSDKKRKRRKKMAKDLYSITLVGATVVGSGHLH